MPKKLRTIDLSRISGMCKNKLVELGSPGVPYDSNRM